MSENVNLLRLIACVLSDSNELQSFVYEVFARICSFQVKLLPCKVVVTIPNWNTVACTQIVK